MSKIDYEKDIVWHGKILRYYGNAKKPAIKERTDSGGWKIYCHHEQKRQVDIVWKRLWNDQDEGVEAVKTGTSMEIRSTDLSPVGDQNPSTLGFSNETVVFWHDASIKLGKLSVFCAAIAGAQLNHIKEQCKQGEWQGFVKTLPFSVETARVYRRLAEDLQARITDAGQTLSLLSLPDPGELLKPEYADSVELVRGITGDKSMRQLCFDWDILKQPGKKGGDHGGGLARANRTPEQIEEGITNAIRDNWRGLATTLNSNGLHEMTWGRLSLNEIKGLQALFSDLAAKMLKHINAKGK